MCAVVVLNAPESPALLVGTNTGAEIVNYSTRQRCYRTRDDNPAIEPLLALRYT